MTDDTTDDVLPVLQFATVRDVAALLSGHADRFASPEAFEAACRHVWRRAVHTPANAWIFRSDADAMMDQAVEESW
jgi:hypothetical protein